MLIAQFANLYLSLGHIQSYNPLEEAAGHVGTQVQLDTAMLLLGLETLGTELRMDLHKQAGLTMARLAMDPIMDLVEQATASARPAMARVEASTSLEVRL